MWLCLADEPPPFGTVTGQVAGWLGSLAAIERYGLDRLVLGRRIRYPLSAKKTR